MKIGAVILAAGLSRRMKQPKVFLELNGMPLFLHAVDVAYKSRLSPIVLVVGSNEAEFVNYLQSYPNVYVIKNEHFELGMGTSLKVGANFINSLVDGAVVFLADQPFVQVHVVQKLMNTFQDQKSKGYHIIRPTYNGINGHPIIFDASFLPEFNQLTEDIGAKEIIAKYRKNVICIPFEEESWGIDIDTPEDYLKAKEILECSTVF